MIYEPSYSQVIKELPTRRVQTFYNHRKIVSATTRSLMADNNSAPRGYDLNRKMRYIIRRLAIALVIVCLCGAAAVSRPVAAAEMGKGHEPTTEEKERQKVLEELRELGVSDRTIDAVKKDFETFRLKKPNPGRDSGKFELPEKDEPPEHHHNPCDNPKTPAEIEQCK